jgi:hypothetical protein
MFTTKVECCVSPPSVLVYPSKKIPVPLATFESIFIFRLTVAFGSIQSSFATHKIHVSGLM